VQAYVNHVFARTRTQPPSWVVAQQEFQVCGVITDERLQCYVLVAPGHVPVDGAWGLCSVTTVSVAGAACPTRVVRFTVTDVWCANFVFSQTHLILQGLCGFDFDVG